MESIVIVGGGVAGLSCMNAMLDKNLTPLLLEGSIIGSPKICGEFLAPAALPILEAWGIGPIQAIQQAQFNSKYAQFNLNFKNNAGAMARSDAELQLAQRAQAKGGRIREQALIKKIIPATSSSPHLLELVSGEIIQAKTAVFATGRFAQQNAVKQSLPYIGIKLSLKRIIKPATLMMFSTRNAYLGIVPISNEFSNCAILAKRARVETFSNTIDFLTGLVKENQNLREIFEDINFSRMDILEAHAPRSRLRSIPKWPESYWIGDAVASMQPAIGSGFAHAVTSSLLATDYYLQNNPQGYLKHIRHGAKIKLGIGKWFNHILMDTKLSSLTFCLMQLNPWMMNIYLRQLGYIAPYNY